MWHFTHHPMINDRTLINFSFVCLDWAASKPTSYPSHFRTWDVVRGFGAMGESSPTSCHDGNTEIQSNLQAGPNPDVEGPIDSPSAVNA